MIIPTRWRKLIRDAQLIGGRVLMMVAAIAVGIYAVTTILSAYVILSREVTRNYVETNPASALIDVGSVTPQMVDAVQQRSDLSATEPTTILTARVELRPDEWVRMLFFVIPDFSKWTVNKASFEAGAYPPPDKTILLEREAVAFLGVKIGDSIRIELPDGPRTAVRVSGIVHDPSLAPAWQEHCGYGYLTPATLAKLGGSANLEGLKIVVRDALYDQAKVDAVAADVAHSLRGQGVDVHRLQIPSTGRHPHQNQMTAVLMMFVLFAILTLILSATLTASMIDALLAQQVRQIAVMKAVGGTAKQIATLYLTGVFLISAAAALLGFPLGALSGAGFADVVAKLLNLEIVSHETPLWVLALLFGGGLAVPIMFARIPIGRAVRKTVREAISDYGVSCKEFGTNRLDKSLARLRFIDRTLILGIRNAFRRRGRLILTLMLLAAGGATFIASLSIQEAWSYFIDSSARDRSYDLELRLARPVPIDAALEAAKKVAGVEKVESWSLIYTAKARADGLVLVRTYPDQGHANIEFRSMPRSDSLSHLGLFEGRWPLPSETDAIVLNQNSQKLLGRPHPGDKIDLSIEGKSSSFTVVGIARQIAAPPAVFVSQSGYESSTGASGRTNAIRVVTTRHDERAISAAAAEIERQLSAIGVRVILSTSETQFGGAVEGHVRILIVSLIFMAVLIGTVGLLGLTSAQGTSVTERTREFGVMRTIGATRPVIIRNVLAEGLLIGLLSSIVAVLLAAPLALGIGVLIGNLAFTLSLPLILSPTAVSIWLGITVIGTIIASTPPALRAARLTVRETLSYV
jgi:putative ABC transport system permease protein